MRKSGYCYNPLRVIWGFFILYMSLLALRKLHCETSSVILYVDILIHGSIWGFKILPLESPPAFFCQIALYEVYECHDLTKLAEYDHIVRETIDIIF